MILNNELVENIAAGIVLGGIVNLGIGLCIAVVFGAIKLGVQAWRG